MDEVKKKDSKTWTGKGKRFKPIGALWSSNPAKAEKTIKKLSPAKKRSLGRLGAKRYKAKKKKSSWF